VSIEEGYGGVEGEEALLGMECRITRKYKEWK
jgi:hypothetical protein